MHSLIGGGGGGGGGGGAGTFLMEHMVTFRKFRFNHLPTPSANEITPSANEIPRYFSQFALETPFLKQKVPVYFSNFAKDTPGPHPDLFLICAILYSIR